MRGRSDDSIRLERSALTCRLRPPPGRPKAGEGGVYKRHCMAPPRRHQQPIPRSAARAIERRAPLNVGAVAAAVGAHRALHHGSTSAARDRVNALAPARQWPTPPWPSVPRAQGDCSGCQRGYNGLYGDDCAGAASGIGTRWPARGAGGAPVPRIRAGSASSRAGPVACGSGWVWRAARDGWLACRTAQPSPR